MASLFIGAPGADVRSGAVAMRAEGGCPPASSDAQLLRRFLSRKDAAAFEQIVSRHGPMVLGVCRRVLGNTHDAEDAYQATFLVLVRKGATVLPRQCLGNWLHGVAFWTATRARAAAVRRAAANARAERERQMWRTTSEADILDPQVLADLQAALDREIHRLPARYRAPIVACELEGKSRREAAALLGVPEGTVSSRLSRARELLRRRLGGRRGLLSAGVVAAVLARSTAYSHGGAVVLASSTVKSASLLVAGKGLAAVTSAKVAALTNGSIKTLLLSKLQVAAASVAVAAATVGTGVTVVNRNASADAIAAPIAAISPVEATASAPPTEDDLLRLEQEQREEMERLYPDPINLNVPHISTDPSVQYDYDIVYVRAPRFGDDGRSIWAEVSRPHQMDAGADLVLLRPDGSEDLLVTGGKGSVADPVVSFDGEWVYYAYFHDLTQKHAPRAGSDIYKIHLSTKKIVRLTDFGFTPNTGVADWSSDFIKHEQGKKYVEHALYNLGPCQLPNGKVMFVSNRNGFRPPKNSIPTLQLFVMDDSDDGPAANIECVGHFNLGAALHPTVLIDGRVMFSSLESQGLRTGLEWGLWSIHPDGTGWNPVMSAFATEGGAVNSFHFQTQLSRGEIVLGEYYVGSNFGMGTLRKMPPPQGDTYTFGPAWRQDPRNPPLRTGRFANGMGIMQRFPFSPRGITALTPFTTGADWATYPSIKEDENSPRVGKFTHPAAAPDNHALVVYTPGPGHTQHHPQADGGIYLIKDGKPIDEPAQMRLIKNDPRFNEQWPRAVVPYQRIYGIEQPKALPVLANDGALSPHLPEGTPFGLVGSSSLYKRESYPDGVVPPGSVTATYRGGDDPWQGLDGFTSHGNGIRTNWANQGADAGLYTNDEIHAIRVLAMEPTTDIHGRRFFSHANERLRILGEVPVRKFGPDGQQPLDPDGNPDTSFLLKIPGDQTFTFQTLDKNGIVLNFAQTWHQVRPGEVRNNCGGCHAHSQQPTDFNLTAAARPDYKLFDLTKQAPLLASKVADQSKQKWDTGEEAGLRFEQGVKNVEYYRDIKPLLDRSCVACHTEKSAHPAGNLVLDAAPQDIPGLSNNVDSAYIRLAMDEEAKYGHKPSGWDSWGYYNASRYIRKLQSRRSLLTWKILGRRTDGWTNDDHPSESEPGRRDLVLKGEPVDVEKNRSRFDVDFVGSEMPPKEAVEGTYKTADGQRIKVPPLSDEEKRTIIRWIDLGCPIDLEFDPANPQKNGGWMLDENRPTLTLAHPRPGQNETLSRIVVGMHDYYSGLDEPSFSVIADFPIAGVPAGGELAKKFQSRGQGVWELKLTEPLPAPTKGVLTVSVKDKQGNTSRVERTFSIQQTTARRE